jgi:hypothetical protein
MKFGKILKRAYQGASNALAVLIFGTIYLLYGAGYLFAFVWIPLSPLITQLRGGQ